jgi:hypothetical protein
MRLSRISKASFQECNVLLLKTVSGTRLRLPGEQIWSFDPDPEEDRVTMAQCVYDEEDSDVCWTVNEELRVDIIDECIIQKKKKYSIMGSHKH